MRPALLVVIMDFLVSSLLLFVSGPGEGWSGRQRPAGGEPPASAPEFSPAALQEMERLWQAQYQEQFREMRLLDQQSQLARAADAQRRLQELHAGLERQLADRAAQLEQEQQRRAAAEAERLRLAAEHQRQQAALQESAQRLQDLDRQREALLQEQERMQAQIAAAAGERTAAQAEARNLQALKTELDHQVAGLRGRLQAQAETIGAQHRTIASQQEVIDQSLQDVARIQTRLETKTDLLSGKQDQMQALLRDFQAMAEGLPEAVRAPARDLALEQQRLNELVRQLSDAVADAGARHLDAEARTLADSRLETLAAMQQNLQDELRKLFEQGMQPGLQQELQAVQQQQAALQSGITGLAGRLEEMETRQAGPFANLRDACLPVSASLTAAYGNVDDPSAHTEVFENTVYAPLLNANGAVWLVVHGRDLGLKWAASAPALHGVLWNAQTRGGTAVWRADSGRAALLETEPALVRLECAGATAAEGRLSGIRPMPIIGYAELAQRGARDVFLVKRQADGAAFAVDAAPDQATPAYLKIRRALRPWANFVARRLWLDPRSQAEPGDFIVTAEGAMVGVMVDEQRCRVLDAADFGTAARPLPLADIESLRQMLAPLRKHFR